MKITVDGKRCMGHGRCYTVAPDLLSEDEEGYVTIRDELLVVPDSEREAAEDAVASCPEEALTLIED
jgi:ferredoxin